MSDPVKQDTADGDYRRLVAAINAEFGEKFVPAVDRLLQFAAARMVEVRRLRATRERDIVELQDARLEIAELSRLRAAAPDSISPRSSLGQELSPLSGLGSVADQKDAARGRWLIRALHCDDFFNHFGVYTNSIATRERLVDAAMAGGGPKDGGA